MDQRLFANVRALERAGLTPGAARVGAIAIERSGRSVPPLEAGAEAFRRRSERYTANLVALQEVGFDYLHSAQGAYDIEKEVL